MTSERLESAVATRAKLWQAASVDPSSCGQDESCAASSSPRTPATPSNAERGRTTRSDSLRLSARRPHQEGQTGGPRRRPSCTQWMPTSPGAHEADAGKSRQGEFCLCNTGCRSAFRAQHAREPRALFAGATARSRRGALAEQVRHPPSNSCSACSQPGTVAGTLNAPRGSCEGAAGGEHALGLAAEESLARNLKRLGVQECRHVHGLAQRRAAPRRSPCFSASTPACSRCTPRRRAPAI